MNKKYIFVLILCAILGYTTATVFADETETPTNADELKSKIEDRNNQIKSLEAEIKLYNDQTDVVQKQAKTLQNTIKTLDLTQKKINTDLVLTEKKVSKTLLSIQQINGTVNETKDHIERNKKTIARSFQLAQQASDTGLLETMLSKKSFDEIWTDIETMKQMQEKLRAQSEELVTLTNDLNVKQQNLSKEKKGLENLSGELKNKKELVEYNKKEKATLLADTKNKEQTYKELIKTRQEQIDQFEKELFEFESQLKLQVDVDKYPKPKNGILSWPVDKVFITQRFGSTVDSKRLYTSGSHNGVDFRASTGTAVKSVLDGVVVGTGNTDIYRGCYSFGKWVMVKHPNGLSTVYGHLSVIKATQGQSVSTGDIVGYSGNTGYSTGPHLHISLYATQGVRIEQYVNSRGCKQATIPLADIKAYLDPMQYFPTI